MATLKIEKIPYRKRDVKKFIRFAWDIYPDDPHWVPPLIADQIKLLNPQKNPFFEHSEAELFGAYENGKMVGRIAVGINVNSNKHWNEKVAFFGFFEAVNRQDVANALFEKARQWGRDKGMNILRGPFNLTFYNEAGLLIDGFNTDPFVMMTHNPKYYVDLIENCGFTKAADAYAFYSPDSQLHFTPALLQLADHIKKTLKPTIRPIDKGKNFMRDVFLAMDMVNESLANNWGSFPMTKHEVEFIAKDLKVALDPHLCFFIEIDKKPVGIALTFPNYNVGIKKANGRLFPCGLFKILYHSRKITKARTWQLGMIKEYQKSGLGAYCYVEISRRAAERGINGGEMSMVFEQNKAMCNGAQMLGGKKYKTYRWYEKRI